MTSVPCEEIIVPFLKWAGGKRWFCQNHLADLPSFPGCYIEPFLGSAAVFFSLQPGSALLSDLNGDLITTYEALRDHPGEVEALLLTHHEAHSAEYYYSMRGSKPIGSIRLAAWFIYLNRTCWNGLYRVNRRNEFNVPIGTKSDVVMKSDNFFAISKLLQRVELRECDFEAAIDSAKEGDLLFVDPPYTVKHNLNGSLKYNDKIFSWDDQIRLRDAIQRAIARGVLAVILNANHKSIRELYNPLGLPRILSRSSVLAGDPSYRAQVEELMVCSWASDTGAA